MFDMAKAFKDYRPGDMLMYAPADPIVPLLAGLALHAVGATQEPLRWMRWERRRPPAGATPEEARARSGLYVPALVDCRRLFSYNWDQDA